MLQNFLTYRGRSWTKYLLNIYKLKIIFPIIVGKTFRAYHRINHLRKNSFLKAVRSASGFILKTKGKKQRRPDCTIYRNCKRYASAAAFESARYCCSTYSSILRVTR